jgi:four helix bundle protein
MATVRSYRDLDIWHKAMDLAVAVYQQTREYPKDEQFGLTAQTRRAATSVSANIAEGQARRHTREFRNFLSIALGSLAELETHLEMACRLEYMASGRLESLLSSSNELGRMIHGLRRSLAARS